MTHLLNHAVDPFLESVLSAGKLTPTFNSSTHQYTIASTLPVLDAFRASFNSTIFHCTANLNGTLFACDDPALSSISISATPINLVVSLGVIGDSPSKATEYTFALQQQLCTTSGLSLSVSMSTNCSVTSNVEAFCLLQDASNSIALTGDSGSYCTTGYLQYFASDMSWVNCTGSCLLTEGENLFQLVLQNSVNASAPGITAQLMVSNG